MKTKEVYVNDALVGEAVTWATVYQLLMEKGLSFVGEPNATEGPSAFYLRGEVEKLDQSKLGTKIAASRAMPQTDASVTKRAKAIAKGLINTERAGTGVELDNGMLRLECLNGGYYWISLDGGRVLRGKTIFEADELQPKFIDAVERAGRE